MPAKKRYRCPCCGTPMEQLGRDASIHLGPVQQALFDIMKKHPNGIPCETIRERVFHTSRRGERYSRNIVWVVAHNVNKKIKQWGLKIEGTGGPGSIYRLIRL
jgi:hypothetical protein